jgi:hypothetical protein
MKLFSMFTCVFYTPKASWGRHPKVCDLFNSFFRGDDGVEMKVSGGGKEKKVKTKEGKEV